MYMFVPEVVFIVQFEQENEQLFSEMNSMVDEVKQIEGKVLEISRLQEIFTEKVLVQVRYLPVLSLLAVIYVSWL